MSSSDPISSTAGKQSAGKIANRKGRDTLVLAGLFGLVLIGLIGLAVATGWQETRAQLMKLTALQFGALLALSLVNYLFRGVRWHIFARRLGLQTHIIQDLRHFIGGFAMSVTPGRVGELVRMRWLRRETGWSFERTAPLVLVDRASDLSAMGVILGLALAFSTTGIAGGLPVTLLALAAAFVVTRPKLLGLIATLGHKATGRFARLWAKLRRASLSLSAFTSPTLMGVAAILGVVGWIAEGYAFHLLLMWMGADIGFAKAVAIFVFSASCRGAYRRSGWRWWSRGGDGCASRARRGSLRCQPARDNHHSRYNSLVRNWIGFPDLSNR